LFTGKTKVALKKCKRLILEDFEPVCIRSPDATYWVYGLKEPTHITLKCKPLGGSPLEDDETTELLLTDAGILHDTSTCYVYAETLKLLPHSLGRALAGLNKPHIVLPSIDNILNPGEQELLQIHSNTSLHLRGIDDAIKEAVQN
jgi:hypothetical protein